MTTDSPAGPAPDAAAGLPRLHPGTLDRLPADVARPRFDRAALRAGIVHLGLGAFHRGHLAAVNDAALAAGDRRWGIVGGDFSCSIQTGRCPRAGSHPWHPPDATGKY